MEQDRKTDEQFVREHWNLAYLSDWFEYDSWAEARAFTEARLEEIRQVEEEIAFLEHSTSCERERFPYSLRVFPAEKRFVSYSRILARERAALADLRKGMK